MKKMSFNNLSKNKKKQVINISIKNNEFLTYESLIRLGIDPRSFDVNSFDVNTIKVGPIFQEFLENLIKCISSLKLIEKELELLGE
jgi:hypothetical protein